MSPAAFGMVSRCSRLLWASGLASVLVGGTPVMSSAFAFTTIDVPGAQFTRASGINDSGQIVGAFGGGAASDEHGFLRDAVGSFTQIDVPGGVNTAARASVLATAYAAHPERFSPRPPPTSGVPHGSLDQSAQALGALAGLIEYSTTRPCPPGPLGVAWRRFIARSRRGQCVGLASA
jgi:hypothetical protein